MNKILPIILLWFACTLAVSSQAIYPVQVQTQLIPPYTPHLPG
jgi:hypothetical protein